MKAELIDHYGTDLTPVNAARVSFNKESDWERSEVAMYLESSGEFVGYKMLPPKLSERDTKLINYLAKHKHTSCFEHQGATLRLKVPIFIARQIHRHRTFSYNEVSRRYVDDTPEFFWPDTWRKRADNVKQGSSEAGQPQINISNPALPLEECDPSCWVGTQDQAEYWTQQMVILYNNMLRSSVAPEQARMVLPQNLYTEFYMSGNLRNWAHFLGLRLDSHAQKEVQDVANMIKDLLVPLWPISMEALLQHQ